MSEKLAHFYDTHVFKNKLIPKSIINMLLTGLKILKLSEIKPVSTKCFKLLTRVSLVSPKLLEG